MTEKKRHRFNRNAPQVMDQDLPKHYSGEDIPHVLALIRTFDRFFDEVVEPRFPDAYTDLHIGYIRLMEAQLRPYAFDLAISLVSLENSLRDEQPARRRKPRAQSKGG